jgi:ATP-dependent RNA helicase SUPV3L1/SUV3
MEAAVEPSPSEAAPAAEAPASLSEEEPATAAPLQDAAAAEAQVEVESAEAAPAAPETIEVWRPQRHAHSSPRGREGGARRAARDQGSEDKQPPRRDQRPRAEVPGKDGRPAGKPRTEGRPSRDDARPRRPSSPPERRERQPDPDSPFAKLAALKAELEKKGK